MNTFLRHANEYYGMLETFDNLYKLSKENKLDNIDLYKIITSRNNILLAYRSIRSNTGSKTKGIDNLTIDNYKMEHIDSFIKEIQNSFKNYKPKAVRRVEIPKDNGKTRPLGIPTMKDRLIQQCIKQVIEPICEAKFYNHSYGFRPNRSTQDTIGRSQFLINFSKLHHVVDVDIQGFFDNVNHTKLIKQCYNIGIKDKRVLSIISKILKAPIVEKGSTEIPTKGTPQGGILSPLLSNIVLNELDWWISSQWEEMKTQHGYASDGIKIRALKNTKLKQMYIVRYADDFKILTDNPNSAEKIFHGVKEYLRINLKLEISKEKSKITNLKRNSSEFLGFEIKAVKKRKKYVANTNVSKKKKEKIKQALRQKVKDMQKSPSGKTVLGYNSYVMGVHNYFRSATHVNVDFAEIAYHLMKTLQNRLKSIGKYEIPVKPNETYKKFYKNNYKTYKIGGTYLYPLSDIQHKDHMNFSQDKCNYTEIGREKLETVYLNQEVAIVIRKLRNSVSEYGSMEYLDNRISKYSMQKGRCRVTNIFLEVDEIHCHHIKPRSMGGTDKFDNLIIVHKEIHELIHAVDGELIKRYLEKLEL